MKKRTTTMQAIELSGCKYSEEWKLLTVIDTPLEEPGSAELRCPDSGIRIIGHPISTIEIYDECSSTLLTAIETLSRDIHIHSYDFRTGELVESHVPLYSRSRRTRVWRVPLLVKQ